MMWYAMQRIFDRNQPKENLFTGLRPKRSTIHTLIVYSAIRER